MSQQIQLLERAAWYERARGLPTDDGGAALAALAEEVGLIKSMVTTVKVSDEDDRTLEFVISDETVDRDRDVILAKGWQLKNYRKNPVVLFAHQSRGLPIARALKVSREGDALVSRATFTTLEENPMGDMVLRLLKGKFLNAASVGFLPSKLTPVPSDDEDRRGGIDFEKQELLEWSIVPVPANPSALIRAHEAGIDTAPLRAWAEEILDTGKLEGLGRNDVERAWEAVTTRPIVIDFGASEKDAEPDPEPKEAEAAADDSPLVKALTAVLEKKADDDELLEALARAINGATRKAPKDTAPDEPWLTIDRDGDDLVLCQDGTEIQRLEDAATEDLRLVADADPPRLEIVDRTETDFAGDHIDLEGMTPKEPDTGAEFDPEMVSRALGELVEERMKGDAD